MYRNKIVHLIVYKKWIIILILTMHQRVYKLTQIFVREISWGL